MKLPLICECVTHGECCAPHSANCRLMMGPGEFQRAMLQEDDLREARDNFWTTVFFTTLGSVAGVGLGLLVCVLYVF